MDNRPLRKWRIYSATLRPRLDPNFFGFWTSTKHALTRDCGSSSSSTVVARVSVGVCGTEASFRFVSFFTLFLSHQIFGHIHRVLNVDKKITYYTI